jgi:hypothetical protein
MDWDTFLAEATDVFVAKNTDYDSRFTRALIQYHSQRGVEAARTIWAWEVEKKLDRCRTWINRGELLVKDEGVKNSVIDAVNYTAQWLLYQESYEAKKDPLEQLTESRFFTLAAQTEAYGFISYWKAQRLIEPKEDRLQELLLVEMTGLPF